MSYALSTVQTFYACLGRGDIAGLLQLLSTTVEWHFVGGRNAPCTGTVKGHGGVGE